MLVTGRAASYAGVSGSPWGREARAKAASSCSDWQVTEAATLAGVAASTCFVSGRGATPIARVKPCAAVLTILPTRGHPARPSDHCTFAPSELEFHYVRATADLQVKARTPTPRRPTVFTLTNLVVSAIAGALIAGVPSVIKEIRLSYAIKRSRIQIAKWRVEDAQYRAESAR